MVQNTTLSAKKSAGRPAAFDRPTVVDKAVGIFWRRGFDDTSLDDLEKGLGVSRSTLYNSFGGKNGLYESAINAYLDRLETVMVSPLLDESRGLQDLREFADRLRGILTSKEFPPGCLVVNAFGHPNNEKGRDRYLESFRSGFDSALQRAAAAGELASPDIATLADTLTVQLIGLNLAAKAGLECGELDSLIDSFVATIDAFARPQTIS